MRGVNFSLGNQNEIGQYPKSANFNSENYRNPRGNQNVEARQSNLKFTDVSGGPMISESNSQYTKFKNE